MTSIKIDKEFIKPEIFVVSKNYSCLPMFVSLKTGIFHSNTT